LNAWGYIKSKSVTGVEVAFSGDGNPWFNLCILKKDKSSLHTESVKIKITNIEELPSKLPVCLVLNGKGIIHKKLSCKEDDSDKALLERVLPNANINDFYLQRYNTFHDHIFVSIVRKSQVDPLLKSFKEKGLTVISCTLSPFIVSGILPLLKNSDSFFELEVPGYMLNASDGVIESFHPTETIKDLPPLQIGNESVYRELVFAFASALSYFLPIQNMLSIEITEVNEQRNEFKQKTIFQFAGLGVLVFFLSLLLINYFVFDHYWKKKNMLESEFSLSQESLSHYEKLKTEFEEKQKFFEKAGLLDASRTSWYADRLAEDIPDNILLKELEINPLQKKSIQDTLLVFLAKTIHVSGSCKTSGELNDWTKIIRAKQWVKQLNILNYSQDKEQNIAGFSLEILVK
jgi:Tfp pilus assembly protein PilN